MSSLPRGKEERTFSIVSAPHLHSTQSTSKVYWGMFGALLPLWIASLIVFGWDAFRIFLLAVGAACGSEYLLHFMFRSGKHRLNGNAALIGALFAFLLPPEIPSWAVLIGATGAVLIGRELFGGLGENLFHPSLFAYVFVQGIVPFQEAGLSEASFGINHFFLGAGFGLLGDSSMFALLIGVFYVWFRKWLSWEMPVLFLLVFTLVSHGLSRSIAQELFRSAIFLVAFFFVTDFATTPITRKGRLVFAAAAGVLAAFFQMWAGTFVSMAGSVLVMNASVPLLDRLANSRLKSIW